MGAMAQSTSEYQGAPNFLELRLREVRRTLLLSSWVNKGGDRSGAAGEQLINEPQHQEWDADRD